MKHYDWKEFQILIFLNTVNDRYKGVEGISKNPNIMSF